ncbi:hypothetical protein GOP47_0011268 [Adiantum capillus-veneris]|uniref:Fe2OG dioxygenase domain-containing protein n=1 Tax=Adiantum capillus-veneris TaxID=13818 RepID=A0A9D4ZHG7_ADICA|nr:hypothetical protein GOP47_0011268 [Adiantum capillus-veneris]
MEMASNIGEAGEGGHEKKKQVKLVQELLEVAVTEVPREFLVPAKERPQNNADHLIKKTQPGFLPLIDLAGLLHPLSQAHTLHQIALACEEWGFFQAINHGIPRSIIEGARLATRQFFELPMEKKLPYYVDNKNFDGFLGYGHTDFFQGVATDWMDSLFGFLAPEPLKRIDLWPSQPQKLRGMVESYGLELQRLFTRLLVAISKSLGKVDDHLEKEFRHYNLFFRANYYPPCPQPELVLGTHGHKDHGCLTVLLQDKDEDGLQVFKNGQWFSIDPTPDALVINIGDQLQTLTNGKYKSALHRGVVSNDQTIITLVAHLDPPHP